MSLLHQSALVPEPFCIISVNSGQENPNKLFLGGIPSQATEKQLEDFFSQFGIVKDVRIVTDRITAECKGYGFVTFDDGEDIQHLVDRKTIRMAGKKIRIRKAIRRNSSQFDHIHAVRSRSDTYENTLVVAPENSSSMPIVIPRQSYLSSETHVTTENFPSLENYVNPLYFPLSPPDSPEMVFDVPQCPNISPNPILVPPVAELGMLPPHQNSLLMSPSPLFHPNCPVFHFARLPLSNNNSNWFRY